MEKKHKILLIKTGAFGDIVLCSFSINATSHIYPDADIYILTSKPYAEIYEDCDIIKNILVLPSGKNIFRFIRFVKQIQKMQFQTIVDLQGNLKTNLYGFLFHGKERIGLYKKLFGKIFLTKSVKKQYGLNPVESQKFFWEKTTGIKIKGNLQIWISKEKKEQFLSFLKKYHLAPHRYVVFHPSASSEWETKKWPDEYWGTLGNFFLKKNLPVVLIGDKNSVIVNEKIKKLINGKTTNLAGKTNFFTLALVIQYSKICITTDSGPMHVAAASGTNTIAIFGHTNPSRHAVDGVKFVKSTIACSPCYKKKCVQHSCMKSITPETIIDLIMVENP